MMRMKTGIATVLATALAAGALAQAQRGERLSPECRRQIVQICGLTFDRTKIRQCLVKALPQMSDGCRKEISARAGAKATPVAGQREMSFGGDPLQKLDFVTAVSANGPAPLVVFIHGGGWLIGDKAAGAGEKAAHFSGAGYAFASVDYRLVPQATVADQAADIAASLTYLRGHARELGVDGDRIVLMGHSAGAHLAALVASDPTYLRAAGVPMAAVRGVVLLDGAGYDVARQMARSDNLVQNMYVAAFGTDPAKQAQLSPIRHAAAPNAANWLILPVATRADSVGQSKDFAAALNRNGARATVTPVADSNHMKLNRNLGTAGDFATGQVDGFLKTLF